METYTLMRAFHLMRNGRARVRSVFWDEGVYCYLDPYGGNLVIKDSDGGHYSLHNIAIFAVFFNAEVMMGSWEVVS